MTKRLRGQFNHSVDAKGRLIIPAKIRDGLGSSFVITKGFDKCLYAYPEEEWDKFSDRLESLPSMRKDVRTLKHFFLSAATDCEIDGQGRILIPASLREHAELTKDVVVIGSGTKVEIWDKARFDAMDAVAEENVEEIAESLSEELGNILF